MVVVSFDKFQKMHHQCMSGAVRTVVHVNKIESSKALASNTSIVKPAPNTLILSSIRNLLLRFSIQSCQVHKYMYALVRLECQYVSDAV